MARLICARRDEMSGGNTQDNFVSAVLIQYDVRVTVNDSDIVLAEYSLLSCFYDVWESKAIVQITA